MCPLKQTLVIGLQTNALTPSFSNSAMAIAKNSDIFKSQSTMYLP